METAVILLIGLIFIGSVCSTKLSLKFNMPSLLVFLVIGMVFGALFDIQLGDDRLLKALSIIHTQLNWGTAEGIGTIALAFILFSGGFGTDINSVKKVWKTGGILASAGVLLTALIQAWVAYALLNGLLHRSVDFAWCLLLSSIISSTDAAAVFSILRSNSVGLKGKLQDLLEFESGSNDPMATFLTAFAISLIVKDGEICTVDYLLVIPKLLWQMGIGVGVGVLGGKLTVALFNALNLEHDGLYYVLGLGTVLVTFSLSCGVLANGFMAVYAAGVYLGNNEFIFHNGYGRFIDAVGWLMQVSLFCMLGFLVDFRPLWEFKFDGMAMALALMFFTRPLACFLGMAGSRFSFKERVFVSWVGLRGGAPIVLATMPLMADVTGAEMMFHIIFFMVLLSVIFQGSTIMPLARWLKLDAPMKAVPRSPLVFENLGTNAKRRKNETEGEVGFEGIRPKEFSLGDGSDYDGKTLAEAKLPREAFVIMIRRGESFIVPKGNTRLLAHDVLTILGTPELLEECGRHFQTGA